MAFLEYHEFSRIWMNFTNSHVPHGTPRVSMNFISSSEIMDFLETLEYLINSVWEFLRHFELIKFL